MLRLLGVVVLSTLLVAGCGSEDGDPGGGSADHQEREWQVAGDPDATADEIIDAGSAVDVVTSGEQTLVSYRVESDDDEGPQQGAWRLYDGDKAVADDRLGQVAEQGAVARLFSTEDGFLLENYTDPSLIHIAPDGATQPVQIVKKPRPVQAGDLLVRVGDEADMAYRPADHTASQLPKLPTDQPQRIAIDDEGVVWVVTDWTDDQVKLAFSAGGAGPWTRDQLPVGKGGYPVSEIVTGSGQLTLLTGHGEGEYPVLDAIWTRPAGMGKVAWQPNPLIGVDGLKALEVRVEALADGRLLLEGDTDGAWLQQPSGGFAKLRVPDTLGFFHSVTAAGDRIYTTGTQSGAFLVSDDDGESWNEFKR